MSEKRVRSVVYLTHFIIALLIGIGVGYDLLVSANEVPNWIDTISGVAKRLGWAYPVLPFAYFGLGAHFWFNHDSNLMDWPDNYIALAAVHIFWLTLSGALSPLWRTTNTGVFVWMVTSAVVGMVTWTLLWPQRPQSMDSYG